MRPVAAALLAALLLVPTLPAQPEDEMPLPRWAPGDHWVLREDLTQPATGTRIQSTSRVAYVETANVTFHDAPTRAHRVDATPQGAGQNSTTWYRAEDLAKLRVHVGSVAYTQDAPCPEWQFPLVVGKRWNTTCTFTASEAALGSFTLRSNWTVERAEDVSTPAGTFHAFVVLQEHEDGATRSWFAPRACHFVKQETMDATGVVFERVELASFRCAAGERPAGGPAPGATTTPGTTPVTPDAPRANGTAPPTTDATTTTTPPSVAETPLGAWAALLALGAVALARRR